MIDKPTGTMTKRLTKWMLVPLIIMVVYMVAEIFKASVIEQNKWKSLANSQQVKSTVVSASRGTIFDSTGSVVAQSITVYNIYCDPRMFATQLKDKDAKRKELKELIEKEKNSDKRSEYEKKLEKTKSSDEILDELTKFLSQKLKVDKKTVKQRLTDTDTQYSIIKKNVEKKILAEIENKLTDLGVDGIRGEPTTRRAYPQGSLLANVVGHTSYDGDGIYGLEKYYNEYLSGVDGRVVTAKDKEGNEIPYRYKQSYDPQNGSNLNLNIDANIQYKLEKALDKAVAEHKPTDRACGIIMNPKTGQVYAMATSYSYDPNNPGDITNEEVKQQLAGVDENSKKYKKIQLDAWSTQWKNKAISEIYFPGSVFKVITGSSALEEKAINLKETFSCNTAIQVEDTKFHCWSFKDHGPQTFATAMLNSCNPAFIQIGMKLGAEKFCRYFDAYGFNELTGIDLPGEVNSISMSLKNMGSVELASSSFGQTNKVTPIQMATAYSAVINGGYLVTPQVVNTVTDSNGNVVKKNETVVKRQVISKNTSKTMRSVLQGVVEGQTGSNCYIPGYKIGGKSGTSQKIDEDLSGNTYVASYCAFAPADDPELLMFVMVDHPTGEKYYGSQVAAPICVEVMSDILPYKGFLPEYTEEELKKIEVSVPSVQYYTVKEAKRTLEGLGLKVKIRGDGDNVLKQYPSGVKIENGGSVVLYTQKDTEVEKVTVPNLQGLTRESAKRTLEEYGLNLTAEGSGADEEDAVALQNQSVNPGESVPMGSSVSVTFSPTQIGSQ